MRTRRRDEAELFEATGLFLRFLCVLDVGCPQLAFQESHVSGVARRVTSRHRGCR